MAIAAAVASPPARPQQVSDGVHTLIQTGTPYTAKTNLQVDMVLVADDESERSLKETDAKVRSWRERGARVYGFASVARVYDYYMRGGWTDLQGQVDAGNHDGEIQRDRFGAKFGPHEFMLMPSARLVEHKKLWAKSFIDAGAEGMAFEEPDIFMDGGYDDQFKKEWQAYYRQPWQPPHSSIAARWKSERLKAFIGYRTYRELSAFCKARAGDRFQFMLATHSLPNYQLWGISFNYFDTLSLPSVDTLQAQVWTGTAKTPILFEGKLQERLFDNAYADYSYAANLAEALGKTVSLNLDPYEDDPSLAFDFYKKGFEHTLTASLMFPQVNRWELLPWPDRIYTNNRIPPLYGTELQNVLTTMGQMGKAASQAWNSTFPRTGILFSESALYEMRDPQPANPQSLFALTEPLLSLGVPVDVVPLEAVTIETYLNRFRVLFLSYDFYKPLTPQVHTALARWVKNGGVLVVLGGRSAYNAAPMWWRTAGWDAPTPHLLAQLGISGKASAPIPQRPGDIRYPPTASGNAAYAKTLAGFFDGLRGADHIARAVSFVPNGQQPETNYFETQVGPGNARADLRFADASGFFTYKFYTAGLRDLKVRVDIANTYLIEASTDDTRWTILLNALDVSGGKEIRDGSNRAVHELNLTPFLNGKTVYLRFRDPMPQNGWGPSLYQVTLVPTRPTPIPATEAPLNLRDSYAAGYFGVKMGARVFVRGANNVPMAFARSVGKGEVLVIGAPPALFGASREKSQVLQNLYREICRSHKMSLRTDGSLRLSRGDYRIVYPIARQTRLTGRYLDVLSPNLDIVEKPLIPVGSPRVLLDIDCRLRQKQPTLLFASHQTRGVQSSSRGIAFTVEGPERIPAACRLFLGDRELSVVACRRVHDGQPVTPEVRRDANHTVYVRFENQEGGVYVEAALR